MTSLWEVFTPFSVSNRSFYVPQKFRVRARVRPRGVSSLNSASFSHRCAVGGRERDPALCGLQEEVLPEASGVFCGQPGH